MSAKPIRCGLCEHYSKPIASLAKHGIGICQRLGIHVSMRSRPHHMCPMGEGK